MEVPTIVSNSSLLQQTLEQNVDIPVQRRSSRFSSPGQKFNSDAFLSLERISEQVVEQIVDISLVSGGGLEDFRPGQSSSSSSHFQAGVHEDADEPSEGFFRTFPQNIKKCGVRILPRLRGCPPVLAHPRWRLSLRMRPCRTPSSGCSSVTSPLARPATGTGVLVCPPGSLLRASRSSGSELRRRRGGPLPLAQGCACQYV